MPRLTKTEILECGNVARALLAAVQSNPTGFDTSMDFAVGQFSSPRFAKTQIRLNMAFAAFQIRGIEANSDIRVTIPNKSAKAAMFSAPHATDIERVIWGVVAHELTHIAQKGDDPQAHQAARALKVQFDASAKTSGDYFTLYIDEPLEQEARAVQAATEVFATGVSHANQPAFERALRLTEVHERTVSNIGAPGSGSSRLDDWWREYADLAWATYQTL